MMNNIGTQNSNINDKNNLMICW